jgi:dipeptidyl aminopeptidase/acylaminoacyl peptidase
MLHSSKRRWWSAALVLLSPTLHAETTRTAFAPMDVFKVQWVQAPAFAPKGDQIAFERHQLDVMQDRRRSTIWLVNRDGSGLEPLTTGQRNDRAPQFSPDGKRLAFLTQGQIVVRFLTSGRELQLTQAPTSVEAFQFSPDGKRIVFRMSVAAQTPTPAALPNKPTGATWAPEVSVIDQLQFRRDGEGFISPHFRHLFVIDSAGGAPLQITRGDFNHDGFDFIDAETLVLSANRSSNAEFEPLQTDLFELSLASGVMKQLTKRKGPDDSPNVSPDGRYIAYVGYRDRQQFYQVQTLSLLDRRTGKIRRLTSSLDRDVVRPQFSANGREIYFQFDDQGQSKLAALAISSGKVRVLASDLGSADIGRPYGAGGFALGPNDALAYSRGNPSQPAELGFVQGGKTRALTSFNASWLAQIALSDASMLWTPSSVDQLPIQAWVLHPPGFDAKKKYPLLLEIHGGPVANYGPHFSAELQLYAAAGYVVVYANPRGSDSYGAKFGNAIHHDYPNKDYHDLMSVVDAVIAKGGIDSDNLFVTGGSGGGVLTAWIVGHTDRFRAAVVAKPVINWMSFVLTADSTAFFHRYWFPGKPWEASENYLRRSPLMYVGKVKTPTMLITGEADYRTPISESEQYFTALKLANVPTRLVRIPGASHSISARPSNLLAQVQNSLAWFERYRKKP